MRTGTARCKEVDLVYEDWGDISAPPLLLIMGLGAQMVLWPDDFCASLVGRGFRVIRFDNRDAGMSGRINKPFNTPMWKLLARAQLGLRSPAPYTLENMADDVAQLMDHLEIASAHVVGASMGGMITQVFAATYPERVRALTILFSSTNQPLLPPPAFGVFRKLISPPRKGAPADEIVKRQKALFLAIGSAAHPMPEAELDALIRLQIARGADFKATARQFAAILATGDLRRYSQRIQAPTVVIHGLADKLVRPAGGKAIAKAIAGARLQLVKGMAHDLPRALWPQIIEGIGDR
ncbi:alpha/beta fold hydrolase [Pseudomonas turukhanskensis]|uniref:Alpha/beta hydrolase n=1 Tax=Pseudomonas turukhanskensis TaxID=1806536 RepID=A0A9W6NEM7_9PSED|nr:alpha/beta hydrolase [Pseudomonas turukhanskensis]GLK88854.1 alpha/beta hydrolase [Pseudomonas turukhanskensis]